MLRSSVGATGVLTSTDWQYFGIMYCEYSQYLEVLYCGYCVYFKDQRPKGYIG